MRRIRRLPVEIPDPEGDSTMTIVDAQPNDEARSTRASHWASALGGIVALGLAVAALSQMLTV